MTNDALLTAAISNLSPKYECDDETRANLRKVALSPRFIFINLDELHFINDSNYSFNFSGDEAQIQKILLYLFSCDFYAMYCDKFFRTIENGVEHRIFRPWHMRNNLPNNMVANYIRYVIHTKNIVDCESLLTEEPPLDDNDYDHRLKSDPRFMPASTQYYILYSPYQERIMYTTNNRPYRELCYRDISPVCSGGSCLESETSRIFTSREAVVDRQIYHAVHNTWRIAVDDNSMLVDRITKLTDDSNNACRSATTYLGPELSLPKCHTNNWWLNLHNFTLTVDDIRASKTSIASLNAFHYVGAFLYTHKDKFDDYSALADAAFTHMGAPLDDPKKQMHSMLYVHADPKYYLDFFEKHDELYSGGLFRYLCWLRYLVLRVYQRTINVKDLESYYLYLSADFRKEFVNELFTLPLCDFKLFYPFVVDTSPSEGDDMEPRYVCKMSFNKTSIRYHTSPVCPSQTEKTNRAHTKNDNPPPAGPIFEVCPDEPVKLTSPCAVEESQGKTMDIKGDQTSITVTIDTSLFTKNPCGFEEIFSKSV